MFPKVSVIIPVYNSEKYIERCIDSILKQTYKNTELIIINDGSTDNSDSIINSIISKDIRIKYIKQINSGPSEARNNGISKSSGEYLVFIDSDDTVDEYYIEHLLKTILDNKYDIVCCGYVDISRYGIVNCYDFKSMDNLNKEYFVELVCGGTGGVLWSKMFKRDIIFNNNLKMDKDIFMCEDLIFVLQYVSYCKSFGSINEYLYNYNRLNESSITSNISIEYLNNYISVCKNIDDIFKSMKIEELKVSEIITNRMQSAVINLLELQDENIVNIGLKESIKQKQKIISTEYVKIYREKFSTDNILYKPYISLIKKEKLICLTIYGIFLNIMKNVRRFIKYK